MTSGRAERIVVFSSVYPNSQQPLHGLFVQERVTRVARHLNPVVVVAPVPWFPLQGLIRRWRPHFRTPVPHREIIGGIEVIHPRFISVPGVLKFLDGLAMAVACLPTLWRLRKQFTIGVIDAHFAYPDGYAATWLGRWLSIPVVITLRGTIVPLSRTVLRRRLLHTALRRATRVIAVCDALKRHAVRLGIDETKIRVIPNGVDPDKFQPLPQAEARRQLGLPPNGPILISVGGLVERKGFHRVMDCLPPLRQQFPTLRYLIAGGGGAEGDWSERLRRQVAALGLNEVVTFLGPVASEQLGVFLSGADVFVLATRNEGWANVFLEAMACGLPVVTTDVGGNAEVVCRPELGILVPFEDPPALEHALAEALRRKWDRAAIVAYARANSWDNRIVALSAELRLAMESQRRRPEAIEPEVREAS
jgi:teichuronic acid biosynthesis glycosyltransferase TuaC